MKPKKISKKLSLNKSTVTNLSNVKMLHVKGGAPLTSCGAPDLCPTVCPTGVCCPWIITESCPPDPEPTGTCWTEFC